MGMEVIINGQNTLIRLQGKKIAMQLNNPNTLKFLDLENKEFYYKCKSGPRWGLCIPIKTFRTI
jgi:hypothetical protein